MLLNLLINSPGVAMAWIAVIVVALSVHEFSHALVARLKGDPTAEQHGRLTLNPIAHMDPMGLIPLFLFGFGWAKPVPYNPYHFQNPRWDSLMVSLAGPASNLVIAGVAGVAYRALSMTGGELGLLPVLLVITVLVNLLLFFFNLVPIYPLDGSKILDSIFIHAHQQRALQYIKVYGPRVLLGLVVISIFTPINAFFFVSVPAQIACSMFTGEACFAVLAQAM